VLVVEGPAWRENDAAVQSLLREEAVSGFRMVVLVDDAADCVRDDASFLWTAFTRFEPRPTSTPGSRTFTVTMFHSPRQSSWTVASNLGFLLGMPITGDRGACRRHVAKHFPTAGILISCTLRAHPSQGPSATP